MITIACTISTRTSSSSSFLMMWNFPRLLFKFSLNFQEFSKTEKKIAHYTFTEFIFFKMHIHLLFFILFFRLFPLCSFVSFSLFSIGFIKHTKLLIVSDLAADLLWSILHSTFICTQTFFISNISTHFIEDLTSPINHFYI